MEAGKKGVAIQRYKGCGRDESRAVLVARWTPPAGVCSRSARMCRGGRLLFSVLMGDAVEPRRQFIEAHALDVQTSTFEGASFF